MNKRILLLLALAVIATLGPMATARACSCMMPDAAAFLDDSDFVFAGRLVEVPGRDTNQMNDIAYTFQVDAVYKGDLRDDTVEVWSAPNGAACGFEMAPGQPVAIAASFFEGRLSGGLCTTFDVGQLEAAASDAGIEPVMPQESPEVSDQAVEAPSGGGESTGPIAAGIFVTVIGVVAGVLIARRSGRADA